MTAPLVVTERLEIVPLTEVSAGAAIRDRARLEAMLGARLDPEWPLPDMRDLLPVLEAGLSADPRARQWGGLLVRREDRTVVGEVGFHAPAGPDGEVEVGYSVVPSARGRGYATEAVIGLVGWAFETAGVKRVVGRCLKANAASARVLEKAGFRLRAEDDGQGHRLYSRVRSDGATD